MSTEKWLRRSIRRRMKDGTMVEGEVIIHICSHPDCDRFGTHLIRANWMRGIRGTAYCWDHLPANEKLTFGRQTVPAQQAETNDADQPDAAGAVPPGDHLEP